jgi:hypothetical protein
MKSVGLQRVKSIDGRNISDRNRRSEAEPLGAVQGDQ